VDQFEFVNKLNIQRFQNLLGPSLNESERQIILPIGSSKRSHFSWAGDRAAANNPVMLAPRRGRLRCRWFVPAMKGMG
jgi:hypothetical protein